MRNFMHSGESFQGSGMLSKVITIAAPKSPSNKLQGQTAMSYVAFCDFIANSCEDGTVL